MAARTKPKPRTKIVAPRTRKISGKIVKFRPNVENELASLHSLDTILESMAWWTRKFLTARCPGCHVKGSLTYSERVYGLFISCTRADDDLCSYKREETFKE